MKIFRQPISLLKKYVKKILKYVKTSKFEIRVQTIERNYVNLIFNLYKKNPNADIPYFFKSLPKTSSPKLRKRQLNELEVLRAIDKISKDNKASYWLDCGTLIGAYRHEGFIPWDDDIDIGMLEKEFNLIKDKLNTCVFKKKLVLREYYDFNEYGVLKAYKVYFKNKPRCFIDIYLYITIPKFDDLSINKYESLINSFKKQSLSWKNKSNSFLDKQYDIFYNKLKDIFGNIESGEGIIWSPRNFDGFEGQVTFNKFKYNDIYPLRELPFEGYKFYCPNNTKKMLEKQYGGNIFVLPDDAYKNRHY